jgi:hypothetical protein
MNTREKAEFYLKEYYDKPVNWIKKFLGVELWSKQREIVESTFNNRRTTVRAAHSIGKTLDAACIILAFMYLRPPAKVITTAPSWYQVTHLLWSEINHLFKMKLEPQGFPGEIYRTMFRIADHWFAVGLSPKEDVNFQGFHQKNILVVFDEAPGVREDIAEGADSLLASGNAHMLKIGNPTKSSGHFYDDFRDPSVETFHISAFDSPNFTGEDISEEVKQQLVNQEWVEDRKVRWGVDSPLYVSRVLADFPSGADERQLISLSLCEEAVNRDIEPFGDKEMGIDVARYGDDLTCYVIRHGKVILPLLFDSKRDTMEVAGRAKRVGEDEGIKIAKIDEIGLGAGTVDRLLEQREENKLKFEVVGINSGGNPTETDKYFNLRAEMWFNAMEWLKTGKIPNDELLLRDLTAPRYEYTSKGQYKLEPKEKTKKRLGYSPDRGDGFVLAVHKHIEKDLPDVRAESQSYTSDDLMKKMGIV